MRTWIAIAALLPLPLLPAQTQLRRDITMQGPSHPTACTQIDAALLHQAAPALRNLQLHSPSGPLPFAIDESYDQQSADTGITGTADRSFYDTVADLQSTTIGADTVFTTNLPARVPVERIRLTGVTLHQPVNFQLEGKLPDDTELVRGQIDPQRNIFPVTLGANLQSDAQLTLRLNTALPATAHLLLEMRRRWLCFPATASPWLTLGESSNAQENAFSRSFHMPAQTQTALLQPAYFVAMPPRPTARNNPALLVAAGALLCTTLLCAVAAFSLFKKRKV